MTHARVLRNTTNTSYGGSDMISELERQRWKHVCLLHLKIYVEHQERDTHLFRTLVDSWYAYDCGEPLLNKSGRPKWLNNPDPAKEGDTLRCMPYVSVEAMKRINGGEPGRLVRDHVIPIGRLRKIM